MGCLYRIVFPNGKSYIGMTISVPEKRFNEHRYHARIGTKLLIYAAMRAHGLSVVKFEILAIANNRKYLEILERSAINVFGTRAPRGYNLTNGGDGAPLGNLFNLGKKRSPESRAKMSVAKKGKLLAVAVCAARAVSMIGNKRNLGKKASAETRKKQSDSHKNKIFSITHRVNISLAAKAREARRRALVAIV